MKLEPSRSFRLNLRVLKNTHTHGLKEIITAGGNEVVNKKFCSRFLWFFLSPVSLFYDQKTFFSTFRLTFFLLTSVYTRLKRSTFSTFIYSPLVHYASIISVSIRVSQYSF